MRRLRRILALAGVSFIVMLTAGATIASADCGWLANPNPGTPLYIRSGPGTGYPIVAQLSYGTEFYGLQQGGCSKSAAWIHIDPTAAPFWWYKGTPAYANRTYATPLF
jgi:uncharacterized protein YraI